MTGPPAVVAGRELRFVAGFALAIALVTSAPYALAHLLDFRHWRFNGNLVFDPDFNVYFGFVRQAAAGRWLFHDPFTPEPHEAVLFNLEWLAVGKLAAVTGTAPETAMQLVRAAGAVALCFAFYWLASFLFATVRMRRLVLAMALLGGGFGWLLAVPGISGALPAERFLDTYAGFHPFFWLLLQPHFLLAQVLATVALSLFLHAERGGAPRGYALAGLCAALAGAMRPFDLAYLMAAFGLYAVVTLRARDGTPRPLLGRLLPVLLPAPLLLYYAWLFRGHAVFRWWGAQNVLPPPDPASLMLTLGLAGGLLVLALAPRGPESPARDARRLMACCVLASLALLYSYPLLTFTLQFATTLVLPAVLLGTARLEPLVTRATAAGPWARLAVAGVLVLNSLTSLWLVQSHLAAVAEGAYRTDGRLIAAYQWLGAHSAPRDVVLASCAVGNQLPRYTHNAAFCGHHIATADFRRKRTLVEQFFTAGEAADRRRALLERFGVRYVVVSAYDGLPGRQDPGGAPWLERVFQNEVAVVYRVATAAGVGGAR